MLINGEVKSHCLFAREMTPNKNELLVAENFISSFCSIEPFTEIAKVREFGS